MEDKLRKETKMYTWLSKDNPVWMKATPILPRLQPLKIKTQLGQNQELNIMCVCSTLLLPMLFYVTRIMKAVIYIHESAVPLS